MKKVLALALVASISLVACGSDSSTEVVDTTVMEEVAANDIVAVASSTEGFSTLVAAPSSAALVETLQGRPLYTSDAADDLTISKPSGYPQAEQT